MLRKNWCLEKFWRKEKKSLHKANVEKKQRIRMIKNVLKLSHVVIVNNMKLFS